MQCELIIFYDLLDHIIFSTRETRIYIFWALDVSNYHHRYDKT